MLEISHVCIDYGLHHALRDVALNVSRGEIVVILGANGAGKSSLLKAIAGVVPCLPGKQITLNGSDIARLKPHDVVEAGLALVPEGRGIFGDLTVAENLLLGANPKRARDGEAARRAQVIALFPKLGQRLPQIVRTMSGGEQQMVAIGRALMSRPDVLLLDEPSLGLSPLMVRELFAALRKVRENGVGLLMVEQNAQESLAIADRGYLMENGRIIGSGTAQALKSDEAVRNAYLGGGGAKGKSFI